MGSIRFGVFRKGEGSSNKETDWIEMALNEGDEDGGEGTMMQLQGCKAREVTGS